MAQTSALTKRKSKRTELEAAANLLGGASNFSDTN